MIDGVSKGLKTPLFYVARTESQVVRRLGKQAKISGFYENKRIFSNFLKWHIVSISHNYLGGKRGKNI